MRTLVRHADCAIVHQRGDVQSMPRESPASFLLFEYIVFTIFQSTALCISTIDLVPRSSCLRDGGDMSISSSEC